MITISICCLGAATCRRVGGIEAGGLGNVRNSRGSKYIRVINDDAILKIDRIIYCSPYSAEN